LSKKIGRLKKLRDLKLNFRETDLENDQGFYSLAESLSNLTQLKKLDLDFTFTNITHLGLKQFANSLKMLGNITNLALSLAYTDQNDVGI